MIKKKAHIVCLFPLCSCIQHILYKNAISRCGIIDEDMGHCADEVTVLDNGRAAHALDDAAGGFQQLGIGDTDEEIAAVLPGGRINFQNLHRIFLYALPGDGGKNGSVTGFYRV